MRKIFLIFFIFLKQSYSADALNLSFYEKEDSVTSDKLVFLAQQFLNKDSLVVSKYVETIFQLSELYISQNRIIKADQVLRRSEEELSKRFQPEQRMLILQKGLIQLLINNISAAEMYIMKAKRLFEYDNDIKSVEYALCLYRLALVRQKQSNYFFSNILAKRAIDIMLSIYGKEQLGSNILYLSLLECVSGNYEYIGDIKRSQEIEDEIRKIAEIDDIYQVTLSFKRDVLPRLEAGNYDSVMSLIEKKGSGESFMTRDYRYRNLLLTLYLSNDDYAVQILDKYIKSLDDNYKDIFGFYSEREREGFWHDRAHSSGAMANAICWKFQTPQSQNLAYNFSLYTKDMSTKLSNLISAHASNCPYEVKRKYDLWKELKKIYTTKGISSDSIESISNQISGLEKDIIASISDIDSFWGDSKSIGNIIHSNLKPREVIIDFVIIPEFSMVFENEKKKLLKKEYYGAIIDHHDFSSPKMVRICERDSLERLVFCLNNDEMTFINTLYDINNNSLFNVILKPLWSYIYDCKKVYFCTTGFLHKINFEAIPYNGYRIMDITDFIELSSPSKIIDLKRKRSSGNYHQAQIIGGVRFDSTIDDMTKEASKFPYVSSISLVAARSSKRSGWEFLPGSLYEAIEIDSILSESGVWSNISIGSTASEEMFKGMNSNSPDIIHLSTHGFFNFYKDNIESPFFNDIKSYGEWTLPMQYSGIILSGANNIWTGKILPHDIEDGVLTAEEISQLDLSNTELVVLSACDTGLGAVDDVEGVYGLQRAFKIAGVETILMSLWKISDDATRYLMVEFYKNLMRGKSKHQSLKDAQKYLRKVENGKYDKPEYWASFIMLDGLN